MRGRGEEGDDGSLQSCKKEEGDRNVYLLTSSSDSSVSDQLSKSRQCVRISPFQSTVCICVCEKTDATKGKGKQQRQIIKQTQK